jgi:hypothetical protein
MRSNRRSAGSAVDQCGTIQVVNKRASEETPDSSCKMYHLMRTRERMYDDGERCGRLWGEFFFFPGAALFAFGPLNGRRAWLAPRLLGQAQWRDCFRLKVHPIRKQRGENGSRYWSRGPKTSVCGLWGGEGRKGRRPSASTKEVGICFASF